MSNAKESYLDLRDEEEMWCTEHNCNSSDCPVDEVMCELITMSDKHREEADDWVYDARDDEYYEY